MNKEYKEVYDELKAPEDWKTAIKAQMQEELAKEQFADAEPVLDESMDANRRAEELMKVYSMSDRKPAKKKSNIFKWVGPVAGLMVAAALLMMIWPSSTNNGPVYVTPMEDGQIKQAIMMEDSSLYFADKGEQLFHGGELLGTIGEDTSESEKKIESYEVGGGTISVMVTEELAMDTVEGVDRVMRSFIKEQELYLSMERVDGEHIYTAVYEKDNVCYLMQSEHVAQKDFISFLYKTIVAEEK